MNFYQILNLIEILLAGARHKFCPIQNNDESSATMATATHICLPINLGRATPQNLIMM